MTQPATAMETTPDIQELAIVLAVSNHNPTLLTPDFLAGSGIVPFNWELARTPIFTPQATQVAFTNGITIVAHPGSVTFSESLLHKAPADLAIARLASQYAAALPNLDYRAVSISPQRFVTCDRQSDTAHSFITQTLLSPGTWQTAGTAPLQATLTLVYTFDHSQLRLNIAEAKLQPADKAPIPAILFAGNFHYELTGEVGKARIDNLHQAIAHWQTDLENYQTLINTEFLPQFQLIPPTPVNLDPVAL